MWRYLSKNQLLIKDVKDLFLYNWNQISTEFYSYYLLFKEKELQNMSSGSTFKELTKDRLENFEVPVPPLPEQQKIAEVLSTLDGAIQNVDRIIEKTNRLKKGLMQRLFDKKHDKVKIGEFSDVEMIMGQSPTSDTYNESGNGMPFLQGNADFGEIYPTINYYTTNPLKIAEKGDILLSVRAPVGDVNMAPHKLCIGRGLGAIRIANGSNIFYFYLFQNIKRILENLGAGSTFKAITKNQLENVEIPIFSFPEQQKIAEILSDVDRKLELERKRKEKLERTKKGLMNNLLTGKKRVRV